MRQGLTTLHPADDTQVVITARPRHLMTQRLHGKLIGQPSFRRLWFGQTVSGFGSQVTTLALPLTAVLVLHAGFDPSRLRPWGADPRAAVRGHVPPRCGERVL